MKSKGDPILDAQTLCDVAKGIYIVEGEDNLVRPRNGSAEEVVRKALAR